MRNWREVDQFKSSGGKVLANIGAPHKVLEMRGIKPAEAHLQAQQGLGCRTQGPEVPAPVPPHAFEPVHAGPRLQRHHDLGKAVDALVRRQRVVDVTRAQRQAAFDGQAAALDEALTSVSGSDDRP
jgi:hypothetical protein